MHIRNARFQTDIGTNDIISAQPRNISTQDQAPPRKESLTASNEHDTDTYKQQVLYRYTGLFQLFYCILLSPSGTIGARLHKANFKKHNFYC